MRTPEHRTHELRENWQKAFVDPKIRDLVAVFNRQTLKIRTIASCQGHLRFGPSSPYIYFQCPVTIAALIEKRLLLADVRKEGLHHYWGLSGSFNKEFRLCWSLRSHHLDRIGTHGNLLKKIYTYWFRRGRINHDLALLAEMIENLLNEDFSISEMPDIPNPYDEKNHQKQHCPISLSGKLSNWVFVFANGTGGRFRRIGNHPTAFCTWLQHQYSPEKDKIRSWFNVVKPFPVVTTLLSIPARQRLNLPGRFPVPGPSVFRLLRPP